VSLIDPEILKAIADKALRRRPETTERALPDVEPGGLCAGGGAGRCARPAEFTVTTPAGVRYDCCRDHLLAFAQDRATQDPPQGGSGQVLTSAPPPQR